MRVACALTLVVLLAACGNTARPAQAFPSPTPLAVLASEFDTIIGPMNVRYSDIATALCFSGTSGCVEATMAAVQPRFKDYLLELTSVNAQLPALQARVPSLVQADLGQFRQAIATEISDLGNVAEDTNEAQFWADEARWAPETFRTSAAAQLVRADLRLP